MGFVPEDPTRTPPAVVAYVAEQIGVEPLLVQYGARAQTRTDHFNLVQHYLGYRKAEQAELTELSAWLLERALEHDKPSLLFELACQKLRTEKIVRPAVWRLERLITAARRSSDQALQRASAARRYHSTRDSIGRPSDPYLGPAATLPAPHK